VKYDDARSSFRDRPFLIDLVALTKQAPSRAVPFPPESANARSGSRQPAANVLVLLVLASITYFFAYDFARRQQATDFPDFYAAARMVYEGRGHQLYDVGAQQQFQIRYAGRIGTYYIHPPFETLLYLPFCLWSLPTAYLLWCIFNSGLLVGTAVLFQRHIFQRLNWRVLVPVSFLFPPVLLDFLQGQDSLLLLLLLTMAMVHLRNDKDFLAGCVLGCGLFKFHLILPVVVVLVASRRSKGLAFGFTLLFVILLAISLLVSGGQFLTAYPGFLLRLSGLPLAGVHAAQMANIRGLVDTSGIVLLPMARFALLLVSSIVILWFAMRGFGRSLPNTAKVWSLAFGNLIFATILVSYHLSPHDLCILLLPFGLLSQYLADSPATRRWIVASLLVGEVALFLPPLHLILLSRHLYPYAAVPILTMFWLTYVAVREGDPEVGDKPGAIKLPCFSNP
jgi:hypothetical protein